MVYCGQETNLLKDTVIDNILFTNDDATEDDVLKLMKTYNIIIPNLHEKVDVEGKNISGGNITIVQALLKRKSAVVFVFDEPLAALEKHRRTKVMDMIMERREGRRASSSPTAGNDGALREGTCRTVVL